MPIYMANKTPLHLDAVRMMGVNVKETDNPIGYFGTGLKYAIATLLRTGHSIKMYVEGVEYVFSSRTVNIRGKDFSAVYMNDEKLAYTTDLGKNWLPWQAYRELASNAMDEDGIITDRRPEGDWGTMIVVSGNDFENAYYGRTEIFLTSTPLHVLPNVEIHHGETNHIYYRGVKVYTFPKQSRYTYNLIGEVKLTEDRTLASVFDAHYQISQTIATLADENVFNKVLFHRDEYWDTHLDMTNCYDPSDTFLDFIEKNIDLVDISRSGKTLYKRKRPPKVGEKLQLTPAQQGTAESAVEMLLDKLNVRLNIDEIHWVNNLGVGVYGCVEDSVIKITGQTIDNGVDFLMITLYEEWIHQNLGYADCTRGMQQYLFDKILHLVKES